MSTVNNGHIGNGYIGTDMSRSIDPFYSYKMDLSEMGISEPISLFPTSLIITLDISVWTYWFNNKTLNQVAQPLT
jgi:hypothetical protein